MGIMWGLREYGAEEHCRVARKQRAGLERLWHESWATIALESIPSSFSREVSMLLPWVVGGKSFQRQLTVPSHSGWKAPATAILAHCSKICYGCAQIVTDLYLIEPKLKLVRL